jgi:hypothetical protein
MDFGDFFPNKPNEWQLKQIEEITKDYQALASAILENTASSAHRTAALRLLLESKMTLIHGVTHV